MNEDIVLKKIKSIKEKLVSRYKVIGELISSYELKANDSVITFAFHHINNEKFIHFNPQWVKEQNEHIILYTLLCESILYIFSYVYLYRNFNNYFNKDNLDKTFISLIIIFDRYNTSKNIDKDFLIVCQRYFPHVSFLLQLNIKLNIKLYINKFINFGLNKLSKYAEYTELDLTMLNKIKELV